MPERVIWLIVMLGISVVTAMLAVVAVRRAAAKTDRRRLALSIAAGGVAGSAIGGVFGLVGLAAMFYTYAHARRLLETVMMRVTIPLTFFGAILGFLMDGLLARRWSPIDVTRGRVGVSAALVQVSVAALWQGLTKLTGSSFLWLVKDGKFVRSSPQTSGHIVWSVTIIGTVMMWAIGAALASGLGYLGDLWASRGRSRDEDRKPSGTAADSFSPPSQAAQLGP